MKKKSKKSRKNKKNKSRKQKGGNKNDFGFIFTRCVKQKEDNQIWINCYNSIRKYYKEKILIITDGSNKDIIDNIPLENVELVDSDFLGAGEILPYYYFHKLKPFNKAICMQDSMWFVKKFDFEKYDLKDVIMLWNFTSNNSSFRHFPDKELELATITGNQDVIDMYNTNNWIGSWGGCSFITLDFLNKLEDNYHFLQFVNILSKERSYRHSFERIFGVICTLLSTTLKDKPSLFGLSDNAKTTQELKELNLYGPPLTDDYMLKLYRGR